MTDRFKCLKHDLEINLRYNQTLKEYKMQCPGCKGIPLNYEKLNIVKDNDENKISEENHK